MGIHDQQEASAANLARNEAARTARARSANGPSTPGLDDASQAQLHEILQDRLGSLIDLQLTLKHVHWNVVGANFIAVHEMLDPQVAAVRIMSDALAERLATLGGSPVGTPGFVVSERSWDDYAIGRAPTVKHLSALDEVYSGVIGDHRAAMERCGELDRVTEDLFIAQTAELELFQWFVRAHLQDAEGNVVFRESERTS